MWGDTVFHGSFCCNKVEEVSPFWVQVYGVMAEWRPPLFPHPDKLILLSDLFSNFILRDSTKKGKVPR